MNSTLKWLGSLAALAIAATCLDMSPAASQARGPDTRTNTPVAPIIQKPVVGPASVNPANRNPQNTDVKKKAEAEIKKAAEDKKNADAAAARKLKSLPPTSKVKINHSACLSSCAMSSQYHPPGGAASQSGSKSPLTNMMKNTYDASHEQEKSSYMQCSKKC